MRPIQPPVSLHVHHHRTASPQRPAEALVVVDQFSRSPVLKVPVQSTWTVIPTQTPEGEEGLGFVTSRGEEFSVIDAEGRLAFTFTPPSDERVYLSRGGGGGDRYHLMTGKHLYSLDREGNEVGRFEFPHSNNQRKMALTPEGGVVVSGMGKLRKFDRDLQEQVTLDFGAQGLYSAGDELILEKARKLYRMAGDQPVALSQHRVIGRNATEGPDGRIWFLEAPDEGPRQAACYDPKTGTCQRFSTTPEAEALVPLPSGQVLSVQQGQVRSYSSEGDLQKVHNLGPGKLGNFQLDLENNRALAVVRESEERERLVSLDFDTGGFWGRLSASVGLSTTAETLFQSDGPIFGCGTPSGDFIVFHEKGVKWGEKDFDSVADFAREDLPQTSGRTVYLGTELGSGSDLDADLHRTMESACRRFGWPDPTATRMGEKPFRLSSSDSTVMVRGGQANEAHLSQEHLADQLFSKKDTSFVISGNRLEVPETGAEFFCNYRNGTHFTTALPVRVGQGHFLAAATSDGQLHWLDAKNETQLRFSLDQPIDEFWAGPDNHVRGMTSSGTVFALKLELPPGQNIRATEPPIDIEFEENEILIGSIPLQLD